MSRSQIAKALAKQIADINNSDSISAIVEAALRTRDDRAACIVENSDLNCLIPSEIAEKIRSDDLEPF